MRQCWILGLIHILQRTATVAVITIYRKKNEFLSTRCLYRICLQAAIFKPEYNFFMLRLLLAKKGKRTLSESTFIRNMHGSILQTTHNRKENTIL